MCVRRLLAIAMAMLMSSDVVRMSFGCVFLGSLCSPSVHRPAPSTRMAGRGADAVVACFFRVSTVCRSR